MTYIFYFFTDNNLFFGIFYSFSANEKTKKQNCNQHKQSKNLKQKQNRISKESFQYIKSKSKYNKHSKKLNNKRKTSQSNNYQVRLPFQSITNQINMQNSEYYDDEVFQNDQNDKKRQQILMRKMVRKKAYQRKTQYLHPRINIFDHHPVDSRESEQLRKQLISLYKPRIQYVRKKHDEQELTKDYDKYYEEFIKMTLKNQMQQRQMTEAIGEMHQMADILLNKEGLLDRNIFLYNKIEPTQSQQDQINKVFQMREIAHKSGEQFEENDAEQTIKRAKNFLRQKYT